MLDVKYLALKEGYQLEFTPVVTSCPTKHLLDAPVCLWHYKSRIFGYVCFALPQGNIWLCMRIDIRIVVSNVILDR